MHLGISEAHGACADLPVTAVQGGFPCLHSEALGPVPARSFFLSIFIVAGRQKKVAKEIHLCFCASFTGALPYPTWLVTDKQEIWEAWLVRRLMNLCWTSCLWLLLLRKANFHLGFSSMYLVSLSFPENIFHFHFLN